MVLVFWDTNQNCNRLHFGHWTLLLISFNRDSEGFITMAKRTFSYGTNAGNLERAR